MNNAASKSWRRELREEALSLIHYPTSRSRKRVGASARNHQLHYLRDELVNRFAMVDLQPLASRDFKLSRIEAELMENSGVNIGNVMPVVGGMKPDLVRCAMDDTCFETAPSHPDAESKNVVIPSVGILGAWSSAKFGGKHNQCLVQETALVEVFQQGADWLIDGQRQL